MSDDKLRGTGRTTAGILRTLAHALENPDRWVPFTDHSGKTNPIVFIPMFHCAADNLRLAIRVRKTADGVAVMSPIKELKARQHMRPRINADKNAASLSDSIAKTRQRLNEARSRRGKN